MCYRRYISRTALTITAEQCLATVENPKSIEQKIVLNIAFLATNSVSYIDLFLAALWEVLVC